jgi:hypothetical protein
MRDKIGILREGKKGNGNKNMISRSKIRNKRAIRKNRIENFILASPIGFNPHS